MKFAVVCFLAFVAVACVSARPDDKYTSKYDDIDVDQILHSDRLLNNYFKCLMDRGKCTPDAAELKKYLPDALETECSKCSEKQRETSIHAIKYLIDNKREMWNELVEKYDPDKKYRVKFEEEARKRGIKI